MTSFPVEIDSKKPLTTMSVSEQKRTALPYLGFGLRLRKEYLAPVLESRPKVDWFEIISESYLDTDDAVLGQLDEVRAGYPLVMHGISLGIGSPWPLDRDYLQKLKQLTERLQPVWISDHLSWSGADDIQGRLLPLPYSGDTLDHLVPRIREVQDFLERRILLENVPQERIGSQPEIPESEFLCEVAERSDSLILIDIANLHSTSVNQEINPFDYLEQLPEERVQQIHLAGAIALCGTAAHSNDRPEDPIWNLYRRALMRFGPVSTMIERVDTIPALGKMVDELEKARCAAHQLLSID